MKFLLEYFSNFAKMDKGSRSVVVFFGEITDQIRNFAKFLKYSVISRNYCLHNFTVTCTMGCKRSSNIYNIDLYSKPNQCQNTGMYIFVLTCMTSLMFTESVPVNAFVFTEFTLIHTDTQRCFAMLGNHVT